MLTRLTVSKNLPCLVRCLSSSAHLCRSIPLVSGSKKVPEKQKSKTTSEERKVFARPKVVSGVKKEENPSISKNVYLPLSVMPKLPKHLEADVKPVGVNFEIPDNFIKKAKPTEPRTTKETRDSVDKIDHAIKHPDNDKALMGIANTIAHFIDPDPNKMYPSTEHPIRKTFSGMSKINPALDKISDEYLWSILPTQSMFGVPPYQKDDPLGFEKWEQKFIEEEEQKRKQEETDEKEYEQFMADLNASESFVSSKGTRKKVDRKLLKKYKKMKKDGKLPNFSPKIVITIED